MKPAIKILLLALIFPVGLFSQKEIIDDIYFSPNDAKSVQKKVKPQKINPINGARQIVFYDRDTVEIVTKDSTYLLAQANDDTENEYQREEGHYLNEFNGSQSDLEYAERIRKFHNPKYTVFLGDPNYNDIYFLNNFDWNVYVDGSYAYVTPTFTNPYWFNYNYNPYSYNSWGWGNSWYSPYTSFGGWGYNNWGYNNWGYNSWG